MAENWATLNNNPAHRGSPFLVLNKRGRETLDRRGKAAGGDVLRPRR